MPRPLALPRMLAAALVPVAMLAAAAAAVAQPARGADPRATLVVSATWLAEHLKDPDLVLLHVGDRAEYDAGHIPGARYVGMRDVSTGPEAGGPPLELLPADDLRARVERLGISDRSRVVVYYGNDWVSPATRIILALDAAGLGERTSLLDGGMRAWRREGRALTAQVPQWAPGKLTLRPARSPVVTADWVKERLGKPGIRVIDARAAVFYDGVRSGEPRAGHIAGARSLPFTEVTNDSLALLDPTALLALFRRAGVEPGDTVVAYCHIGQQATAVVFAARTLGIPVFLYDGSYAEWARRTDLPVENPAARGGASR